MKTFRLFFSTIVVLFLVVGISIAQDKKTTKTECWSYDYFTPCANEFLVGEECSVLTFWDGKYQCRYEGTYIGSTSHKSYTWSAFENQSYKVGKASNETYTLKMVLKCEGIPIATSNFKYHITINANGEIAVEKLKGDEPWSWTCK